MELTDRPSASSCVMKRLGGSGTLNTSKARPFASVVLCSTSRAAAEISNCDTFHATLYLNSHVRGSLFSRLNILQSCRTLCQAHVNGTPVCSVSTVMPCMDVPSLLRGRTSGGSNLGIRLVICPGQQYSAWPDKAAEIVHVAVGVEVRIHTLRQPDDFLYGQVPVQLPFYLLLCQVGVAVFVQKALGCGHQRPEHGQHARIHCTAESALLLHTCCWTQSALSRSGLQHCALLE